MAADERRAFRLLPSERVLWTGVPRPGVPRDLLWTLGPSAGVVLVAIACLFAALGRIAGVGDGSRTLLLACDAAVFVIGGLLAPRHLLDPCRFMITDRRVLWKRGRSVRSIDSHALTYARVRWHRSVPGLGHLELVRSVPFGPFSRGQRMVLHDIEAPDRVLSLVRGETASPNAGDEQLPLTDRLDVDEQVLWGAGPEGWLLGWRDLSIGLLGVAVVATGVRYALTGLGILVGLEEVGLSERSWTWVFFSSAMLLTAGLILGVGGGLVWFGFVRARQQGRQTEYVVTSRRLLIRRGRTELSIDRARIFDVATTPSWWGLHNAVLILDGPGGRALGDSGAFTGMTPSRESVPPVLYELRDPGPLRAVLGTARPASDPG